MITLHYYLATPSGKESTIEPLQAEASHLVKHGNSVGNLSSCLKAMHG